jgi:CRISPR-associated protein (TIGR02584 family)
VKNILLAVVGLTPQVITEALYALHQEGRTVNAIHIITSSSGKEAIHARLLASGQGAYYRYLKDYGLDPLEIEFGPENVHVLADHHGIEIDDIIGIEENEILLQTCLDQACRLTLSNDTSVYFLIAGGRKTMSACLAVAAQFYGRPQDRVYHVLISPEFESTPDFFYPPPQSVQVRLYDQQGQPFLKESRFARIDLVQMPFVSIRNRLTRKDLQQSLDPATLLMSLVLDRAPQLIVNLNEGKIVFKGRELDVRPALLALYSFFALEKKDCRYTDRSCRDCTDCFLNLFQILTRSKEIADLYRHIISHRSSVPATSDTGILALDQENFASYKAKIHKILMQGFGTVALRDIQISSLGKRPETCYGLPLDRKQITVIR